MLLRAAEHASGIEGAQTVRLAYDILGPVPVGPVQVRTSVVRPGRRVELVEAVLSAGNDRPLMRLSAWRMRSRGDAAPATAQQHPAPAGAEGSRPERAAFFTTEIAYHRALDW
ncbi:acyl-CoA thioesterase domain-containing protein, partial [Enterococcus faecium]